MPKSDQNLIEKLNNVDNYQCKKVKIKNKYFFKIIGGYNKIFDLFHNKFNCCQQNVDIIEIALFDSFNGVNY